MLSIAMANTARVKPDAAAIDTVQARHMRWSFRLKMKSRSAATHKRHTTIEGQCVKP